MTIDLFFWVMSIVGAIGTLLLTIIGFLLWVDRRSIYEKDKKQDQWILSIQKEVNETSKQLYSLTKVVQLNQQQDSRRMDIIERTLDGGQIAETIFTKLKAMNGD